MTLILAFVRNVGSCRSDVKGETQVAVHVRSRYNRLDRWIERRLYSFLAKRWRNAKWRRYPSRRLISEFGLVRLTHLIPSLVNR